MIRLFCTNSEERLILQSNRSLWATLYSLFYSTTYLSSFIIIVTQAIVVKFIMDKHK